MQVLKLGGSAITRKGGYMSADTRAIAALAKAIARAWRSGVRDIVLVHGAGSFGHAPVIKYGIAHGVRSARHRLGFAITHSAVSGLSGIITSALAKQGVPAVSLPPAAIIRQKNGRISEFDSRAVSEYLKAGFIPVLYGDMVLDGRLGGSVCSGDQIACFLGKKAKRMIFATNVDGILAKGKLVPKISRKNFRKIARHIGPSGSPDVTGGMAGKIREIMKAGKPAYVVNARKPGRVLSLLLGKKAACTKISV